MEKPPIYQHPELEGTDFVWKKGETAILLLHGFTATTVEVRRMARFLFENDYTVEGPLLPGHGTTPDDLNSTTWKDWFGKAEEHFLNLKNNHKKIIVMGESMGALLTIALLNKYPEILGGILFAPAIRIPQLFFSKVFRYFRPYIYKKNTDDTMPWQGYNVVPLKAAASLYDLQQEIKRMLPLIHQPVMIFQGRFDQTIDPISSVNVLERIGSKKKELVWLEESGHVILLDSQLHEVQELALGFLNKLQSKTNQRD